MNNAPNRRISDVVKSEESSNSSSYAPLVVHISEVAPADETAEYTTDKSVQKKGETREAGSEETAYVFDKTAKEVVNAIAVQGVVGAIIVEGMNNDIDYIIRYRIVTAESGDAKGTIDVLPGYYFALSSISEVFYAATENDYPMSTETQIG